MIVVGQISLFLFLECSISALRMDTSSPVSWSQGKDLSSGKLHYSDQGLMQKVLFFLVTTSSFLA